MSVATATRRPGRQETVTAHLTIDDYRAMRDRLDADPYLTWRDIAEEIGVKYTTLHKAAKRYGMLSSVPRKRRRRDPPIWFGTAEEMFLQGWPTTAIAERVQVSTQTVTTHLRKAGYDTGNAVVPEPHWVQEAVRLLDEELMSVEAAARRLDVSPGRLRAFLRRRGWTRPMNVRTLRGDRLTPEQQRYNDIFTKRMLNWRGDERMTDFLDRMVRYIIPTHDVAVCNEDDHMWNTSVRRRHHYTNSIKGRYVR